MLCTAPNKYMVVDATGAVKPQCCVDMWAFFSIHFSQKCVVLVCCWLCWQFQKSTFQFWLSVLRQRFLFFKQSHQTQGCASMPLRSVRQVPAAGVGAEPTESSGPQGGDGHPPSFGVAGSDQLPHARRWTQSQRAEYRQRIFRTDCISDR